MVAVGKARVYRAGSRTWCWTWHHANCDAMPTVRVPFMEEGGPTYLVHPTQYGPFHESWRRAYRAARRHMEREHGIGIRA